MTYDGNRAERLPVAFEEWERRAKAVLPVGPYDYVDGGAGAERTIRANQAAFDHWRILPRVFIDIAKRDLHVSLFGQTLPAPVLLAPISIQGVVHPDGELGTAKAAAGNGIPFVLSTISSRSIEQVAAVMGNATRWFQLFWPNDRDVAASLVHRAEASGYKAIVLTVDLPLLGFRERDVYNGYFPFLQGEGTINFMTDPAFRAKAAKEKTDPISLFVQMFFNPGLTWNDLPFLRKQTKLPILLKGILHPGDAELALHHGVDGIVVSNHGGRQIDGEVASLDALPIVCDVIQGRIPVLMDSGIRRGADVIKALALGAKAVLLGRPYVYGLAVAGEAGVSQVIGNLLADLDITMGLSGRTSPAEIDRSLLVKHVH